MNADRFRQIRHIFEAALDRSDSARDAYLVEACHGDAELAAEVSRLLAAHGEPTRLPDLAEAPAEPRLEGRILGTYEILRQIGRGGMGIVYLAVRADHAFRRKVAIKVIRSESASPEIVARFQREREILASLNHPNIAALLDGGSTEEGWPYFVMEYIDGEPIDRYCDQHRLSIEARLQLFDQVCAAVQHAHTRQIIHRDLKPNNILVTAEGEVKLLDFGIAHNQDMPRTLTQAGVRAMTPEYASPEQVRGEAVGIASDVYSLGVVLYELLTGRTPLRLHSRVFHEIARVICEQPPTPPSTAVTEPAEGAAPIPPGTLARLRESSLVELQSRLKGDLDHVVLRSLEKEPSHRYLSAEQFRLDIERYRKGEPVIARANSPVSKAARVLYQKRHTLAAALLVTVAVATGAVRIDPGALRGVALAGALLGLLAIMTSKRWGRRLGRILAPNQGLVLLAAGLGASALLLKLGPTKKHMDMSRYFNIAAMAVFLLFVYWRARRAGPVLVESVRKSAWRYVAVFMVIIHLAYSLFSPRTDWLNTVLWSSVALWAYTVVGRLQVREQGILAAGFWIPWGIIESWSWLHPAGGMREPEDIAQYWLLRIEMRTGIPIFDVLQMKVMPEAADAIDAALTRYLAVWPTQTQAAAASVDPTRKATLEVRSIGG